MDEGREGLVKFAEAKAAEARALQASRESMSITYRNGSDAEWNEGRRLAELQAGRAMPVLSGSERQHEADRQERIAAKYADEAAAFEAIAAALAPPGQDARPFDKLGADRLADEVAVLVRRGVLDSRSPAADALLDYRNPPSTPRADRLAQLESRPPGQDAGRRVVEGDPVAWLRRLAESALTTVQPESFWPDVLACVRVVESARLIQHTDYSGASTAWTSLRTALAALAPPTDSGRADGPDTGGGV